MHTKTKQTHKQTKLINTWFYQINDFCTFQWEQDHRESQVETGPSRQRPRQRMIIPRHANVAYMTWRRRSFRRESNCGGNKTWHKSPRQIILMLPVVMWQGWHGTGWASDRVRLEPYFLRFRAKFVCQGDSIHRNGPHDPARESVTPFTPFGVACGSFRD